MIRTRTARRRRLAAQCTAVLAAASIAACTGPAHDQAAPGARPMSRPAAHSPLASLLAASTDLGPSRARDVEALVSLTGTARPTALYDWAGTRRLAVRWHRGDAYAIVRGAAQAMGHGFGVAVHDYRSRSGTRFYATTASAAVPAALRASVTGVGRILSYTPKLARAGRGFHADVPAGGLTPSQLLAVYNATPLARAGYTGKGATIVFFEIDGYKQSDLDAFSNQAGLNRFMPTLDTRQPGEPGGETPMDLEVAHAIAPDAKLVVFDAAAHLHGSSYAELGASLAESYRAVDQKYPGAIWSISLGLNCESDFTLADLQPSQQALQQALAHGTTAFVSSGDSGSLECKGGKDFGTPPTQADVGLNALSGPPAMTVVGGTALSTDAKGRWVAEQAWTEPALQQGTSGGPSGLFPRPSWQQAPGIDSLPDNTHRLTPDVAADADPATGVKIYIDGEPAQGGGTSQAAPIWAALTVLMNQYLADHGGKPLGDINPLLYAAAAATPGAFHDVTLGGNVVDLAGRGFDFTTGLGSPNVTVLAEALRKAQKGS